MSHTLSYRPNASDIPTKPGVYTFRDEEDRVLYVGKASNLRARLSSYFAPPETLTVKTRIMVTSASSVKWTVVGSEMEALQLEYTWIKEYNPRFNVSFRDDKTYPYLAVTMQEEFPRVMITRQKRVKGARYFGPYTKVGPLRDTLDSMISVFPLRSCSKGVFQRAKRSGRACLLGYIERCSAPCVGKITADEYRTIAEDFSSFMGGDGSSYIRKYTKLMQMAAAVEEYENAAKYRDMVQNLTKVFERNAVVLGDAVSADIYAVAEDELEASVQVFYVRGGRIKGQQGWIVEKVEDIQIPQLVEQLIQQRYGENDPSVAEAFHHAVDYTTAETERKLPKEILVPVLPDNVVDLESWLTGIRGSKVTIKVPRRGDKAHLSQTILDNAKQAFTMHKMKRAGDITTRSEALQELQQALNLPAVPLRIECYDISHISGTDVVGSMTVLEDGLPQKSEYRKFTVQAEAALDDTASIRHVITRRFRHYLEGKNARKKSVSDAGDAASTPQSDLDMEKMVAAQRRIQRKFSYSPNLVVVDGGQPQVRAAFQALSELGITDIPVIGLAKRLEEIWLPCDDFPLVLPRTSQALYLLQRVRDEAHRFAITFHRQRRSKKMISSTLDVITGLGPEKSKALKKHFGSIRNIKAASVEELQEVKGIGASLAQTIHDHLLHEAAPGVVDAGTGEITDL